MKHTTTLLISIAVLSLFTQVLTSNRFLANSEPNLPVANANHPANESAHGQAHESGVGPSKHHKNEEHPRPHENATHHSEGNNSHALPPKADNSSRLLADRNESNENRSEAHATKNSSANHAAQGKHKAKKYAKRYDNNTEHEVAPKADNSSRLLANKNASHENQPRDDNKSHVVSGVAPSKHHKHEEHPRAHENNTQHHEANNASRLLADKNASHEQSRDDNKSHVFGVAPSKHHKKEERPKAHENDTHHTEANNSSRLLAEEKGKHEFKTPANISGNNSAHPEPRKHDNNQTESKNATHAIRSRPAAPKFNEGKPVRERRGGKRHSRHFGGEDHHFGGENGEESLKFVHHDTRKLIVEAEKALKQARRAANAIRKGK